jgi:hypothetical protein
MMAAAGVPHQEFKGIREGDFIFEDEIIHIHKAAFYLKIHTKSGAVYTVHSKPWGVNVFRRTKTRYNKRERKYKEKIVKSLEPPPLPPRIEGRAPNCGRNLPPRENRRKGTG